MDFKEPVLGSYLIATGLPAASVVVDQAFSIDAITLLGIGT
jgi:hypothetical protein